MTTSMDEVTRLEMCANELNAAIKAFSHSQTKSQVENDDIPGRNGWQAPVPAEASREAQRARRAIINNISELQKLLWDPADFLQQLANQHNGHQSHLLSCLNWLGEFQVLACIPLKDSVPLQDVAELAGVPEMQLTRVVRMTATAGFLHEPQPGHVAHTALSSPFVSKPSFLDASMFLAEINAPAALQMAAATHRFKDSEQANESAYSLAFNTSITFATACLQRPKLQRQWPAYLRHALDDRDSSVIEILTRLDWLSLGSAKVVEAGARSTKVASSLSDLYPELRFIVQMSDTSSALNSNSMGALGADGTGLFPNPNAIFTAPSTPDASGRSDSMNAQPSRITVQQRSIGSLQAVSDAAVYILHLPPASPGMTAPASLAQISIELRAHMAVLRANTFATIVLTARLLPQPGTVDPTVEAVARSRDLSLVQLANEREIEATEIEKLLDSVRDSSGRLAIVNKLHSRNNATVAFEIRAQPNNHTDRVDPVGNNVLQ